MRLVPDASAIIEVLRRTRVGEALAPRLVEEDLFAPELLDVEVAAAMRRAVLRGLQTTSEARAALALLRSWPIKRVSHRDLMEPATVWWENVTAFDAVYLAVAVAYRARVITVDGPLSRAPVTGVVVENVTVARG